MSVKLETDPSGRACCKRCGNSIQYGTYRINKRVRNYFSFNENKSGNYHPECYLPGVSPEVLAIQFLKTNANLKGTDTMAKKLRKNNPSSFGCSENSSGKEVVTSAEYVEYLKSKIVEEDDKEVTTQKGERKRSLSYSEKDDEPPMKKSKKCEDVEIKETEASEHSQEKMELAAYNLYKDYTRKSLRNVLGRNDQECDWTSKNVLMARVIDGHLRGKLGRCSQCKGWLKVDEEDSNSVICTGVLLGCRKHQTIRFGINEAPRLLDPWLYKTETEDPNGECSVVPHPSLTACNLAEETPTHIKNNFRIARDFYIIANKQLIDGDTKDRADLLMTVSKGIQKVDYTITKENALALGGIGKGSKKKKLPGVGKKSASQIKEYIETGSITL